MNIKRVLLNNGITRRLVWSSCVYGLCITAVAPCDARTVRKVHFENTEYQLEVYHIYGRESGKTLMIIGGIQDETGGYLAADQYVNISLAKGNLIVVPRANFNTILNEMRGVHGDMNRKFGTHDMHHEYDDQIVDILKQLIAQSDILLNLHDGSGFYRPVYINDMYQPMRYGQSIIADVAEYTIQSTGHVLRLAAVAERICKRVNKRIGNSEYHFRFNNHNTLSPNTRHIEQRKSATYYALTKEEIYAYGIETSKQLPGDYMKVQHQVWIINEFMREFDVVPETPVIHLETPELQFIVVSVNGSDERLISNGRTLEVNPGDSVEILHAFTNYKRGVTVDILGYGSKQDYRQPFAIYRNTSILVRKDKFRCGMIDIRLRRPTVAGIQNHIESSPEYLVCTVNNKQQIIHTNDELTVVYGSTIVLKDISSALKALGVLDLNFYGYQAPDLSGEDRGYAIRTDRDLLKKYSLLHKGERYVIRLQDSANRVYRQFYVRFIEPKLEYVVMTRNNVQRIWYSNEEVFPVAPNDLIEIVDVKTNLEPDLAKEVRVSVEGGNFGHQTKRAHPSFKMPSTAPGTGFRSGRKSPYTLVVSYGGFSFGKVILDVHESHRVSMNNRKGK